MNKPADTGLYVQRGTKEDDKEKKDKDKNDEKNDNKKDEEKKNEDEDEGIVKEGDDDKNKDEDHDSSNESEVEGDKLTVEEGARDDFEDFDEDPTESPSSFPSLSPTLSPTSTPIGIPTTPLVMESFFPTNSPSSFSTDLPSATPETEEHVVFDRVLVPLVSFEIRLAISPHDVEPLVEPAVARGSNDNGRNLRTKLLDNDSALIPVFRRLDGDDSFDVASIDFDRLTKAISEFLEEEVRDFIRSQNIVNYSPLQLIVLTPVSGSGGGSRRILGDDSIQGVFPRRALHTDEIITVEYVGTALFLRSAGTKVPSGTIVGTIQKTAFAERPDELLDVIYATGSDSGLLAVSSVMANLLNDDGLGAFPTPSPTPMGGLPTNVLEGTAAIADGDGSTKASGLDIIILAAIIVAMTSLILLAAALFLAFRRKRRAMYFTAPSINAKRHRSLGLSGRAKSLKVNSGASDGVTKESSGSPNATPSESDFSESKLDDSADIRETPMLNQQPSLSTLAGLYPDDLIMDDINSSLAAYKNFDLYARGSDENQPYVLPPGGSEGIPSFPHRDDGASISSMESYSLAGDGYESSSVAPSHIGSAMGSQTK